MQYNLKFKHLIYFIPSKKSVQFFPVLPQLLNQKYIFINHIKTYLISRLLQNLSRFIPYINYNYMKTQEDQTQQSFINIKIKTMNHTLYEIIVNPLKQIKHFQHQIEQKAKVPIDSQRLLYRGFVLDAEKSLADYRIQEGNVIQLVANKIPSEISHNSSVKRTQANRTNQFSKQYNKTKKYRQLQERLNGFRLKKQQSLQVIHQNKHTIDQLIECLNLNFMNDSFPFRLERRKLQIGEWVDVKQASGQWIQGQVINNYGEYVLIHYNGWDNRWNQWISASSQRIMPFRTHTVQIQKSQYLSPFPLYERASNVKNSKFKASIQTLVNELAHSLDNLNTIIKQLELTNNPKSQQNDESLKNVSNISINHVQHQQSLQQSHHEIVQQVEQTERKQQFQTPNKENHMFGDNLSNKCQDDRSNQCDNDDISNKSYQSKRSQGLVDTASMKSLIIDESRKRQNKVFFDHTEEAQSVRSVKNKNSKRRYNTINQQYILQQQDSQINDQDFEDTGAIRKKQLKRKMKASQLAPILDRMGRLLIDIAPHVALLGHLDQSNNNTYNQNLSTKTNEGSLLSRLSQINKPVNGQPAQPVEEQDAQQYDRQFYCHFQVPIMLTPSEVMKMSKLIDQQRRNIQSLT